MLRGKEGEENKGTNNRKKANQMKQLLPSSTQMN